MKIYLALFLLVIATPISLQADYKIKPKKKINISLDLTSIPFSVTRISVDYKIHSYISLGLTGAYMGKTKSRKLADIKRSEKIIVFSTTGWSLGVNSRLAIGHKILTNGLTVTPYISYTENDHGGIKVSKEDYLAYFLEIRNKAPSFFTFGTLLAYEYFWKNGINTSLGLGAYYDTDSMLKHTNSIRPYFESSLGFAF